MWKNWCLELNCAVELVQMQRPMATSELEWRGYYSATKDSPSPLTMPYPGNLSLWICHFFHECKPSLCGRGQNYFIPFIFFFLFLKLKFNRNRQQGINLANLVSCSEAGMVKWKRESLTLGKRGPQAASWWRWGWVWESFRGRVRKARMSGKGH